MIGYGSTLLAAGILTFGLCLGTLAAQTPETTAPSAPAPAPGRTPEACIADLGNDSYKVRQQAEKELRALGKAALPALRRAAESTGDEDVQWRCNRLVREIEQPNAGLQRRQPRAAEGDDGQPLLRRGGFGGSLPDAVRERFEAMFGHLERDFGVDLQRSRFFDDTFFRDLQQQLEERAGAAQSMKMQMGPDGVRVEVQEKNDKGVAETKVYEAPDLESFQRQYPGVLNQHGLGMNFWFDGNGAAAPLRALRLQPFFDLRRGGNRPPAAGMDADEPTDAAPAPALPPADQRLGVTIRPEIAPELREHLGLEDGVGLMVEAVQPDTLAQQLDLARGDIVVRIGDRKIGSAADVQAALAGIEAGAPVAVRFLRRGVEKTATVNKGEAAPAAAPDEGKARPADRLERRRKKAEAAEKIR